MDAPYVLYPPMPFPLTTDIISTNRPHRPRRRGWFSARPPSRFISTPNAQNSWWRQGHLPLETPYALAHVQGGLGIDTVPGAGRLIPRKARRRCQTMPTARPEPRLRPRPPHRLDPEVVRECRPSVPWGEQPRGRRKTRAACIRTAAGRYTARTAAPTPNGTIAWRYPADPITFRRRSPEPVARGTVERPCEGLLCLFGVGCSTWQIFGHFPSWKLTNESPVPAGGPAEGLTTWRGSCSIPKGR